MLELIVKTGTSVIDNIIQLLIGVILSFLLYNLLIRRVKLDDSFSGRKDFILILSASITGALLPLETFGVLPVALMLLRLKLSKHIVLPILFSNTIFNMLIPFSDPSFIWRNGYNRLILAIILGLIAGLGIKALDSKKEIFKLSNTVMNPEPSGARTFLRSIHDSITGLGAYLVIGVILNTLFNEYIVFSLTEAVFSSSQTAIIMKSLGRLNIVHPLYMLGVGIIYALMNFTRLSGLLVVMKPKSLILYLLYCGLFALLLGFSIFL